MVDYGHDIERVSAEIQRYLQSHPHAADTLEGITRWWLTRQRYEEAATVVKKALDILIARGLVSQSTNMDDQCIYRKGKIRGTSAWTQ